MAGGALGQSNLAPHFTLLSYDSSVSEDEAGNRIGRYRLNLEATAEQDTYFSSLLAYNQPRTPIPGFFNFAVSSNSSGSSLEAWASVLYFNPGNPSVGEYFPLYAGQTMSLQIEIGGVRPTTSGFYALDLYAASYKYEPTDAAPFQVHPLFGMQTGPEYLTGVVPEPSTWALMTIGGSFLLLGMWHRRRGR